MIEQLWMYHIYIYLLYKLGDVCCTKVILQNDSCVTLCQDLAGFLPRTSYMSKWNPRFRFGAPNPTVAFWTLLEDWMATGGSIGGAYIWWFLFVVWNRSRTCPQILQSWQERFVSCGFLEVVGGGFTSIYNSLPGCQDFVLEVQVRNPPQLCHLVRQTKVETDG